MSGTVLGVEYVIVNNTAKVPAVMLDADAEIEREMDMAIDLCMDAINIVWT